MNKHEKALHGNHGSMVTAPPRVKLTRSEGKLIASLLIGFITSASLFLCPVKIADSIGRLFGF